MPEHRYHTPQGGLPGQQSLMTERAVFTDAYAVIPGATMRDITASRLPGWDGTRCWILARPLSGFAETFSHYLMDVAPGGGSALPEPDPQAQGGLFVVEGTPTLTIAGQAHSLAPGAYAYLPPGSDWQLSNPGPGRAAFHWIRKVYVAADGLDLPEAFVTSDAETPPIAMEGAEGWQTTRFADPDDLRHDMHVNIVTLLPGFTIPFPETHVMEHGLFILQGKGVYRLNRDWVEVEAGDFLWLRAFCPQACYAGGPEPFRYLLYKDVNRHATLSRF